MTSETPETTDHSARRGRSRRRLIVAGAIALVPLLPVIVALLLSSGGGGAGATAATTTAPATVAGHFDPVTPAPKAAPQNLLLPPGAGALVAALQHSTGLRSAPGGRIFARLATRTEFGSPEVLWVAKLSGRWLGVVTPQSGNGHLGWIPASDASLSRVDWQIKVSLSHHLLRVLRNGRTVRRFAVAVGMPSAPTPTGRFAVTDRLNTGDPSGPYGCCIVALSAKAPHAIQDWSGGNRIAIHSTPETWTIGENASHGCLRLTLAEGRWLLEHIPLGTPAIIST
jgi:hypothetical protein